VFVRSVGSTRCTLPTGESIDIPVVPGILKHPRVDELFALLADAGAARKYTQEALRVAPWSALKEFPRAWLLACLRDAPLSRSRRRALEFLLEP
jgi:predicted RNA polymerase sigma factor